MLKPLSIIAVFLTITVSFGQPLPITVLDNDNLQPIPGVHIYDNEGGIDSTDADGKVQVPALSDNAIVFFKHRLYKQKQISYSALLKNKIVIMAVAEESDGETMVTVNRFPEKKEMIPHQVLALTRKNFELYNPQTTADLLAASDAVYFPKSLPGSGSPMIRGFSGSSLLLSVDGVRISGATGKTDILQNIMALDPGALESAEVMFGPGSAACGSDAMGGVLNFHFREPVLSEGDALKIKGMALGRFALANGEKGGRVNFNLGTKKFGSFTAVSYNDFDDLRMGSKGDYFDFYRRNHYVQERDPANATGTVVDAVVENTDPAVQVFSGYRQLSALEKLRFVANEKITLNGTLCFSATGAIPRYDKLIEYRGSDFSFAEWNYGPDRWLFSALAMEYTNPTPLFKEAKVTLSYQNDKETCYLRNTNSNGQIDSTETTDVLSGNIDCSKPVGEHSVLSYGVELAGAMVSSTAAKKDVVSGQTGYAGSRYPAGYNDYTAGGAYGCFRTTWNPMVTSVAGARYSRVYLQSSQTDALYKSPQREVKINTGIPSGNLGIIVRPVDFWRLSLNGSTGFRAPNIDDMGKIFRPVSRYIRVPNTGLKPEYAYSLDLGNEVAIGKIVQLNAVFFASQVRNLMVEDDFLYNGQGSIVYEGDTLIVRSLVNKGSAIIGGGAVELEVKFLDGLSLKNTVSFAGSRSILHSDTMPLPSVPPLFGGSHLLFKYDRIRGDLFVRFNGIRTEGNGLFDMAVNDRNKEFLYPEDAENARFSPSWYTVNLATTTLISKSLSCNLAVENILDRCYRQFAGGIVAPGRNFIFSLRATL